MLGCRVYADGSPSDCLKVRLDKALQLYQTGVYDKIIVSGGLGIDLYPEALAMKSYLKENGVLGSNIIMDKNGINTFNSALNLKHIMNKFSFYTVTIVTQHFHMARTKFIMHSLGIRQTQTAVADRISSRNFKFMLREIPAFYAYIFRLIICSFNLNIKKGEKNGKHR